MPCSPATTCAAVTTRSGVANQPLPSTPIPHASPRMRTTDADARRTVGIGGDRRAHRRRRRRRPRDRRERVDPREQVQQPARRHDLVEPAHDVRRRTACRSVGWPGRSSAEALSTQTSTSPVRRAEQRAGGGVEEAERRQLQAVAQERAGEARHRLEHERADSGADEGRDRRPRRGRAAVQQVRPDARAPVRAGGEPGERERAGDQPAAQPAERRDRDDAQCNPVHGRQRHAAQSRSRGGGSRLH